MNWGKAIVIYGDIAGGVLLALGVSLLWVGRRMGTHARVAMFLAAAAINFVAVYWFVAAPKHLRPIRASFSAAGRITPELAFERLADRAKGRLSDYRGKVVVLNLWSTWCGPCRREMPALDRVHREFAEQGAVVVAVSDETFEEIGRSKALAGMSLVAARVDAATAPRELFISSGVMRPITHIIDRDGVLRETLLGQQSYESLASRVGRHLR